MRRAGHGGTQPRSGRRAGRLIALLFIGMFLSGTIVTAAHAHEGGQTRASACAVCAHARASAEAPPIPVEVFSRPASDLSEPSSVPVFHARQVIRTARARAPPL